MSAEIQQQFAVEPTTAITEVNTAVAEFDRVAAGIGTLKQQYAGVVFDVATTAGMKAACEARAAIRAPRYEVEKVRKAVKAPLLKLGKDVDARAAQITADLLAIEEPVDQQIKTEEARKEEERKAKVEAERRRIAEILARINAIRDWPVDCAGGPASLIQQKLRHANEYVILPELFQELAATAAATLEASRASLLKLWNDRQAHEAEQERLRLEREELAKQRAAQEEANRLERDRIAAEEAAARAKRQAEEAAAKVERDRIAAEEAEARRQREAADAAAAAERQRQVDEQLAKLRAERLENERIAREQQEAAQAEHARIAADNARQAEDLRRQQEELAERQAEWQREQEKIAALQQVLPADDPPADASIAVEKQEVIEAGPNSWAPSSIDITNLVATEYGVTFDQALVWCVNAFEQGGGA